MAWQLCCHGMCKNLLRSDRQQRSYGKAKFPSILNCGQKNVSETGPYRKSKTIQYNACRCSGDFVWSECLLIAWLVQYSQRIRIEIQARPIPIAVALLPVIHNLLLITNKRQGYYCIKDKDTIAWFQVNTLYWILTRLTPWYLQKKKKKLQMFRAFTNAII